MQLVARKLENYMGSIEKEVGKLKNQVDAQNKEILTAVEDVTVDFLKSYYTVEEEEEDEDDK